MSKPLVKELTGLRHNVIVTGSTEERKSAIESLGATAAIGQPEETCTNQTIKD
jgi:NADPH:quinone reductase-like Zn-dependent oxidoreductase